MKKLILTSTALFGLAIVAHAQFVNQVGNQQVALQEQTGNDQTGTINQVQSPNDPNRTNYGNYAITFQGIPNNTGPNTATINQNDGSQGNRAGIAQGGGNNSALIEQNGGPDGLSGGTTSASATIGAAGGDGNFGGILQQGVNNIAVLSQRNNSRQNGSEIYQNGLDISGYTNTAVVIQSNNSRNNDAFIFQGYSAQNVASMAVSGNQAYIYQGRTYTYSEPITAESVDNYATITQLANASQASIVQGGTVNRGAGSSYGSVATILQQADVSVASINQGADRGRSVGSRASIIQTGGPRPWINIYQGYGETGSDQGSTVSISSASANGFSNIYQGYRGTTQGNQVTIQQTDRSSASVVQGSGVGSSSINDRVTIIQNGIGSIVNVYQNSTGSNIFPSPTPGVSIGQSIGRDNTASILQAIGVSNSQAVVDQGTAFSATEVLQVNGNLAAINQLTGNNLRASVTQGGNAGRGIPSATAFTPPVPFGGNGTIVQLGGVATNNSASITQAGGDNHSANVYQGGVANSAQVTQLGGNSSQALIVQAEKTRGNQALLTQTSSGERNTAIIYQFANVDGEGMGAGNTALISQLTGSDNIALIQQGVPGGGTVSSGNYLRISQSGNANQARMAQVGNNNYADITQNGNNNRLVDALGTAGSFATQQGNNNRLTLIQNAGSGPGQTYKYTQIGDNNTQVVNQNAN
ncbi:hypothetical protein GCM10027341_15800 [Spirosoma knui]